MFVEQRNRDKKNAKKKNIHSLILKKAQSQEYQTRIEI